MKVSKREKTRQAKAEAFTKDLLALMEKHKVATIKTSGSNIRVSFTGSANYRGEFELVAAHVYDSWFGGGKVKEAYIKPATFTPSRTVEA